MVLFLLLLSITAYSYVGLLFLFWVRLFHTVFLSHLPPSSFLEGLSSEQFAELKSVHLLAFSGRACSLALLSLGVWFLAICRAVLIYLALFFGFVPWPFYLQWFCWFQLFKGLIFLIYLRAFSLVFFYRAFLSGSVLPNSLYSGLLCPLRMHAINSCVGDMWQRLWRDEFTHNGKQVVNRLKIPQGLSTLCFVGGVKFPQGEGSAVINRKKNRPALQRRDILTVSLVCFYFILFFIAISFYSQFALLFFHPIFSGFVLFSILHSSVVFETLLFRAFC